MAHLQNAAAAGESGPRLKFSENRAFQIELRRRVDEFFRTTGRRRRDCWQMYLKSALILFCSGAVYVLLVFFTHTVWQGLLLSVALGLCTAGIGFNIAHDGGHRAVSDRPWVNKVMAVTLDMVGVSSYFWRWKHNAIHHTYVNITGWDNDISVGALGRMTPWQKRYWYHQWQHLYFWPLYGFLAIKMQLVDDVARILFNRIGPHVVAPPRGMNLAILALGKATFFALAFVIPAVFHPVWVVLFFYAVAGVVLGLVLSLVFQLPHCVGEAEFPLPVEGTDRMENPWAVHQANVTLDFDRKNFFMTLVFGGLNYHLEHHLFPMICHINYPAMSKVVEQTCREFGVKYQEHASFWTGLASHYRWLRKLGTSNAQ